MKAKVNFKKISLMALGLTPLWLGSAIAGKVDGIEFKFVDNQSVVEIQGQDLAGFEQQDKKSPPQLVLTFNDTSIAEGAARKYDTSSFKGDVLQISAYALGGNEKKQARVVVDLKKGAKYTVEQADGKLLVKFQDQAKVTASDSEVVSSDGSAVTAAESKAAPESTDAISTVLKAANEKKFTGSPITLKLNSADVHDVLRMIGDASGFNVVVHPSVQGKLSLELDQVPWDQALDVVLTTLKLGAERTGSILRVMPRDMLLAEKQAEIDEKRVSAATAPRITRVFPVSYADLGQLSGILQSFASSQSNTPGASGIPTTIISDQNTQSLIVRDTVENVERIRKMIEILDVQTPQVLVETKVVEASDGFNRGMNGNLAFGRPDFGFAFNGPQAALAGTAIAMTAKGGGSGASNLNLGIFPKSGFNLSAFLNIAESEDKAKVVSTPRTVVLSGKSSTITQVTSVAVNQTVTNGNVTTQSLATVSATTRLTVTPRVTNDGSVFMKLDMNRDVLNTTNPLLPSAEPRTMNTEVIVESGGTLVIGGILQLDQTDHEEGFPILRKIPILGTLFGSETHLQTKSELMFFVTPRILNQKKAGITVENAKAADIAPAAKL